MTRLLQSIGPAIIVASVVLGPGSILTSSKVGAGFGTVGLAVVFAAVVLMIGMVALAARIGVIYEGSPCDELTARLGRPVALLIGGVLFVLVALFQSSNNIAIIGGLEPLLGAGELGFGQRAAVLLTLNGFVIICLFWTRDLYRMIERLMKVLIGAVSLAFLINFVVAWTRPRGYDPLPSTPPADWLPLLGMVGTTFSVGGAFYQAYLVKEKGWTVKDADRGVLDSVLSISVLGLVTSVILLTAYRLFHGRPDAPELTSVGEVARQLEPLFGAGATWVFSFGILAGALSSFLVNALIGGTVMADALGSGSRLQQRGPQLWTAAALLVGMAVGLASLAGREGTVQLITFAQALTVLGIPALAAALIYLGSRPDLTGERAVPKWMLRLAGLGFLVACVLACLTAVKVWAKIAG